MIKTPFGGNWTRSNQVKKVEKNDLRIWGQLSKNWHLFGFLAWNFSELSGIVDSSSRPNQLSQAHLTTC